jgi:hypothetical protein
MSPRDTGQETDPRIAQITQRMDKEFKKSGLAIASP